MQIIHLENVDVYTFWRGHEKVYVLYTHLNVDNYGWYFTKSSVQLFAWHF